ncbi:MAG: hypothetical protein QW158_07250 [Nitrososphaerales archaeon]
MQAVVPRIRGFTHSEEEFSDEYDLRDWLDKELRIDCRGCYHLRSAVGLGTKPDALPEGSIVLFYFKKKIVGEGVVEEGVQKIDEEHRVKEALPDEYEYFVKFKPELIRAYPAYLFINEEEFREVTGKALYGYFEITAEEYLSLQQKLVSKR